MDTTLGLNNVADLTLLQTISGFLEGLLHLALSEPAKIPELGMRRAV